MRPAIFTLLLLATLSAAGQSGLPSYHPAGLGMGYYPTHGFGWTDPAKKWAFQPYAAFSTSFLFYKGGSASVFSAPVGVQLTRKLNDNFYAFAGASVAPAYMNFNRSFMTPGQFSASPGYFSPNGLNLYQRAEMGLMYVNDARTFSISGSVSVQRGGNPFMPQPDNGHNGSPISHR